MEPGSPSVHLRRFYGNRRAICPKGHGLPHVGRIHSRRYRMQWPIQSERLRADSPRVYITIARIFLLAPKLPIPQ